ncbi:MULTISPECIES: Hsp70 family protein [Burkholderia]|uniref:Hsp70 family protein n=1 Tax=Burkholderia TaxID=32008 RepID=UPI0007554C09|nr:MULTISPECIES: Hsp70 family protein [Burkholderia]AOJ71579.1 molecular chaperone DnaK [Burkholderia savannae]KVG42007.1 molecular chaperone DnaK [Burkholderia sp. MSMB0265]KVG89819.1 molecular chaperone DnaK [Burkholderia sp. MSMB2040]KVG93583.1 molecular chaperone DnaK [Burkholderia sp. MSMB2042]KVG96995.1 molecular chaperone DnaK [Burkholderia sp. MSMB2041]
MKQFIVGIDLGTSNTVVAYVEAGGDAIRVLDVDQLVAPGELGARPLLPSARYHPVPGEFAPGDLRLPWRDAEAADADGAPPAVIGTLARALGAQVPGRLVTSAKSWLSHASVDRLAPILPWGAADADDKVSPVAASASYLAHVRAAWNRRFPDAPLEAQDVVLTVPASFDDGARALTLEAARIAKLPALRLLEEPQAAFYDWLFHHRDTLRDELAQTRLVLVCDVGGGTTDLTLVKVHVEGGEPQLTRIGVGDHLMLGGDNMDLALARVAETRIAQDGARLSAASLSQLVERCRAAKERLLDADAPDAVGVTLLGSGARLVGGARKTELSRDEVERIVVDGFFPAGRPDDLPRRSRAALVEFGLPYAADPAVTRHVAAFLHRLAAQSRDALGAPAKAGATDAADAADAGLPIPDTLLLNGGVFRSQALADRLAGVLGEWRGQPLHVLHNDHPDVAVARGAVAYGLARAGRAPRIGGGSPRSYFLVVDDDGDDGARASRGVCVLPRGTAEGHEVRLDDRTFALRLGHPVRFHLVSTVSDHAWRPGELADLGAGDFVRLPPVATVVRQQDAGGSRERLVKLTTSLTEVGTLDMHCIATDDPSQRWLLEFQLRRERAQGDAADASRHPSLDKAIELIDRSFGARLANVDPKEVRRLRAQLEQLLGARENWDIALLRELFGALWERAGRRRRSADHERVWLNLAGYCVRPGFGYPLDDWRVAQLWTLFDDGIQYVNEGQVWSEWWTLWRRAAGGLDDDAQRQALDAMVWLQEAAGAKRPKLPFDPAKIGDMDIVRLSASLERVAVERKIELGERLLERLRRPAENHQCWWAIGRIGARRPLYGSAHGVVPPDVASRWLDAILAIDWKKVEPAAFAAVQIARMTGDRTNDLALDVREPVVRRLAAINAPDAWLRMVREVVTLDNADTGRAFGESLPAGLKLVAG